MDAVEASELVRRAVPAFEGAGLPRLMPQVRQTFMETWARADHTSCRAKGTSCGGVRETASGIRETVGGVRETASGIRDTVGGVRETAGGIRVTLGALWPYSKGPTQCIIGARTHTHTNHK